MKAVILAIGDEIVNGLTLDTNSAFLADRLRSLGIDSVAIAAAPDDAAAVVRTLEHALEDAEIVVSTGGLGPTSDDLTTACVARIAGRELRLDEATLAGIEQRFRAAGREMPPNNRKQALVPEGSVLLQNPIGTAPGFICPVPHAAGLRHVICLPGVPHEMRLMTETAVLPWLRTRAPDRRFASRVFSTFGISESKLDELLSPLVAGNPVRLSLRAAFPRVQARLTVEGSAADDLEARLDRLEEDVRDQLGEHLYAIGDRGMEEVVIELLAARGIRLAVAESCTGGLIGHRLTEVPGSSCCFLLGVVSYSDAAKEQVLGVRRETLDAHGAVSEATALEMAEGVRRIAGAELAVAVTGIAGPGGGTPAKPVGTVCIALAATGSTWSRRYQLGERERSWIKELTAQLALNRVRLWLVEPPAGRVEGAVGA